LFRESSTHESNNRDSSRAERREAGWCMGRELSRGLAVLASRPQLQPLHPPGVPRKVPVVRNHCFWPCVPLFVLVCSLTW